MSADSIKKAAAKPEPKPEGPQPLTREILPAIPFPTDALGQFSEAARSIHRVIRAPEAICGQSLLAAIAQIAQAHGDISIDGRKRPTSCFFCCVGETGERKSAVDEVATWPHRKHERALEEKYKKEHSAWEMEYTAWKESRDQDLKKAKTKGAKEEALKQSGEAPPEPPIPAVLIEEPTYEGLIKVLQMGLPSVGLFTDEGGRFIGGHAMNSENALKTAAGISSLWDRGEAKRTRSGDGHSSIHGKRLSIHLMLQGVVAEMLMSNEIFREQGWLSRILMAWPESTVGHRPYVAENIFEDPHVKAYHDLCKKMLEKKPEIKDDKVVDKQVLDPPVFDLSRNAKRLWVAFHNTCDKDAGTGGEYEMVRGLANKAPEHAARIAGVLAIMKGATQISAEDLEAGIELLNYYLRESMRITDMGQTNDGLKDARVLVDWLREKNHYLFYPSLVYQNAPIRKLRDKSATMKVIGVLEAHRWVERMGEHEVKGTRRRDVWKLVHV